MNMLVCEYEQLLIEVIVDNFLDMQRMEILIYQLRIIRKLFVD